MRALTSATREDFATLTADGALPAASNEDAASNVPPILTKTWFHTGFFFNAASITTALQSEYYREGDPATGITGLNAAEAQSLFLPDTALPTTVLLSDGTRIAHDLSGEEMREACRALRGSILRQEVYAEDSTLAADRPYTASEHNYTLEMLQPQGPNPYAVFLTHARETLDLHYERKLYAVAGRNARRGPGRPTPRRDLLPPTRAPRTASPRRRRLRQPARSSFDRLRPPLRRSRAQRRRSGCAAGPAVDCDHRVPTPTRSSPLTPTALRRPSRPVSTSFTSASPPRTCPTSPTSSSSTRSQRSSPPPGDGAHDLAYENFNPTGLNAGQPYRRLLSTTRTLYRPNDLGQAAGNPQALLPLGTLESLALPGATYKQALTPGLIAQVYERNADGAAADTRPRVLASTASDGGGYVDLDGNGNWWIPSTRIYYSPAAGTAAQESAQPRQNFYLPQRFVDPFGNTTTVVSYEANNLLVSFDDRCREQHCPGRSTTTASSRPHSSPTPTTIRPPRSSTRSAWSPEPL